MRIQQVVRAVVTGVSFLAALLMLQAASAMGQGLAKDLGPQPLADALEIFASDTGMQIVYGAEIASGLKTQGAKAGLSAEETLRQLLRETGLVFEFLNDRTIAVVDPTLRHTSALIGMGAEIASHPAAVQRRSWRLAQAENPSAGAESTFSSEEQKASQDSTESSDNRIGLGELVVTGSHIRGTAPVGSPLITIDQDAIQQGGFGSADQLLQSLTQNFGGGGVTQDGNLVLTNVFAGNAVNLRGLGAGSTLTLVNGRRLPASGLNGDYADVSAIPLTAIERVEVMPDGASAIYGSDAIGGVVNFVLRRDFSGAETRARYGSVTDGHAEEIRAGQLLGTTWNTGHAFASYEYYRRDNLAAANRGFASDSDLTEYGGDNFGNVRSNPGNITVTGVGTFAVPAGQDGRALQESDLLPGVVNLQNRREGLDVLPEQERHSAFLALSQDLSPAVTLFAEGSAGWRDFEFQQIHQTLRLNVPETNAFRAAGNLFPGRTLLIDYNFVDDLGPRHDTGEVSTYAGTVGTRIDLPWSWQAEVYGAYADERAFRRADVQHNPSVIRALADSNPATAFNPFGDGSFTNPETLRLIGQGFSEITIRSEVWSVNAKADGALFQLPGGPVKLAIGGSYRDESFGGYTVQLFNLDTIEHTTNRGGQRHVASAFSELVVPLFGAANSQRGLRQLSLSAAARLERYSDFGDTVDPKFGIQWLPIEGLALRGTYGTSFKAPDLTDTDEGRNTITVERLNDPASSTGRSLSLLLQGSNAGLHEETATTWSAGFDIRPPSAPELSLSATYFEIEFEDRIDRPPSSFAVLQNAEFFGPLITRDPDPATVQALFADPRFRDNVGGIRPEDIQVLVDARLTNLAKSDVRGVDVTARYGLDMPAGTLDFTVSGSLLIDYEKAVSATSPLAELVDTLSNPIDLRLRAGAAWSRGHFAASVFLNYADDYVDNVSQPERDISSWTTVDLHARYTFAGQMRAFDNLSVMLNANNVLDDDPPFANNPVGIGYDPDNAEPLGRFVALELIKQF